MFEKEYDDAGSLLAKDMKIVCTQNEGKWTEVIIKNVIIIILLQQQYDIVCIIIIILK